MLFLIQLGNYSLTYVNKFVSLNIFLLLWIETFYKILLFIFLIIIELSN